MEPICMIKNAYGEYVYVIRPYKFDPEYGMVEDEQFIRQIHKSDIVFVDENGEPIV